MSKERSMILVLMGFLGYLAGLFYQHMFKLIEINMVIGASLFIVGLMLLNLIIEKIMPLADYRYSHPIRLLGYGIFILVLILFVLIGD